MQINRRWPIDWNGRTGDQLTAPALLVPAFPVPRGMPAEAAALLPNIAYNQRLLESLAVRNSRSRSTEVATVFAADPFLNVSHFASSLSRSGLSRIANLPTTRQLGENHGVMTDDLGIGPQAELERMRQFKEAGLELFIAVSATDQVDAAIALEPSALIAVFEPGASASSDWSGIVNRLCQAITDACSDQIPVLALTGERLPGLNKENMAGTIRYGP